MDTSLNDIALFVEVARRKNFSRASESCGVPVSTLSRRISELERYIGVKLFRRSTRRVELTEAGGVYFERCQKIIDEARIAHEQLMEVAQQPKGKLRVSIPASFAVTFLPEIMQEFCARYPEIECEFDLSIRPIDLLADPFDLVLRFGEQPDSGVVARHLDSVALGLYASQAYLARHGMPIVPADLAHHYCLRGSSSKEDSTWELHNGNAIAKVPVWGQIAANNVAMRHRMGLQGMGIVPLPCHLSVPENEPAELIRVLPGWQFAPIPLLALFPSRLMPAKTRVFIEFLQERLPELRAERITRYKNRPALDLQADTAPEIPARM